MECRETRKILTLQVLSVCHGSGQQCGNRNGSQLCTFCLKLYISRCYNSLTVVAYEFYFHENDSCRETNGVRPNGHRDRLSLCVRVPAGVNGKRTLLQRAESMGWVSVLLDVVGHLAFWQSPATPKTPCVVRALYIQPNVVWTLSFLRAAIAFSPYPLVLPEIIKFLMI